MSIVRDLKKLQATIFDKNLKRSRASVDRILDKFLQRMYRSNDDLASCNLVDNIWI